MGQRRFIERPQPLDRRIRVRRRLEIREEAVTGIPNSKPTNALVQLSSDRLARQTATRTETAIVTEDTAAGGHTTVDIGARKAAVDADFLHALAKKLSQKKRVPVVPQARFSPSSLLPQDAAGV
jgi:hypothetical protein